MKLQYMIQGWEFKKSTRKYKTLKQEKAPLLEAREEVWYVKCKGQGHDKDHCSIFVNYLVGGPIPLQQKAQVGPSATPSL